ncbi:MAG TPA: hypothetical protein VIQ97_01115, partial [Prevotella sp.]
VLRCRSKHGLSLFLPFHWFAEGIFKLFHQRSPCIIGAFPAMVTTNPHSWLHQPWQLVASTVAVGCTNRGSWLHQPWQLLAPTVAVALANRGHWFAYSS